MKCRKLIMEAKKKIHSWQWRRTIRSGLVISETKDILTIVDNASSLLRKSKIIKNDAKEAKAFQKSLLPFWQGAGHCIYSKVWQNFSLLVTQHLLKINIGGGGGEKIVNWCLYASFQSKGGSSAGPFKCQIQSLLTQMKKQATNKQKLIVFLPAVGKTPLSSPFLALPCHQISGLEGSPRDWITWLHGPDSAQNP